MDLRCGTAAAPRSADTTNATTSARGPLVPVPLSDDLLRGLDLFQTYLVGGLSIVPTDASWRGILNTNKEKFLVDSVTYVFIIYVDKPYHKYRKTLS